MLSILKRVGSFGSLRLSIRSVRISLRCSSSSSTKTLFRGVEIERDVRYSPQHPRNVLDVYLPAKDRRCSDNVVPALLFVHGGMWLRGSKEQNSLSMYDFASHLFSQTYQTLWQDSSSQPDDSPPHAIDKHSRIGLCLAQQGVKTCVMNYRLAADTATSNHNDETGHPHQVMDVARAIAFLIDQSSVANDKRPLHLFVGGHSAGAHLAALVLSDPQYLHMAMNERNLEHEMIQDILKGFIGISGVYNLRRLAMSPFAAVTVGPAFQGKQESDVTLDASPVQVLIKAAQDSHIPPLATVPILLMNAESDFHLAQDTSELLTALDRFSMSLLGEEFLVRQSEVIPGRNHFSIMSEFGREMMMNEAAVKTDYEPVLDEDRWTTAGVLRYSDGVLSSASDYLAPYFVSESAKEADQASALVLEFIKRDKK